MFKVFDSGFQLELTNGYTVSVQFSPMHMCSNRKFDKEYIEQLKNRVNPNDFMDCPNAETAVVDTATGKFFPMPLTIDGEDVQGYQTVEELILLLNRVKDFPNTDAKMTEMKKLKEMSNEISTRNSL